MNTEKHSSSRDIQAIFFVVLSILLLAEAARSNPTSAVPDRESMALCHAALAGFGSTMAIALFIWAELPPVKFVWGTIATACFVVAVYLTITVMVGAI